MSKKFINLLLALSLGINVGLVATTLVQRRAPEGPPPGPGRGPGPGARPDPERLVEGHVQGITRHLDLDAEQQRAIRAVLERHVPQLIKLQAEVEKTSRRLSDVYGEPDFNPQRFRRLTAEASAARSRLDSLSAVMLVAEAAVLTPVQRREYAKVAPSIHTNRRRPPGEGRPPPR